MEGGRCNGKRRVYTADLSGCRPLGFSSASRDQFHWRYVFNAAMVHRELCFVGHLIRITPPTSSMHGGHRKRIRALVGGIQRDALPND
jgi:hypothetical protein